MSAASVEVEDEKTERKGIIIFGQDITKIPCMRDALLYGYIGAAVGGVGGILFKSNMRIACHAAFGCYWLFALGYLWPCWYSRKQEEKKWEKMKQMVNERHKMQENQYYLPRDFMKVENVVKDELEKKS